MATASREFGDDLKFLQELAGDRLVKDTDIKDIVGDGVRYLHERHRRNQKKGMSGGGVVTASSGYRRHGRKSGTGSGGRRKLTSAPAGQSGLGGFLDEEDGTDDGPRRLPAGKDTLASRGQDRRRRVLHSAPSPSQNHNNGDKTGQDGRLPSLGLRGGGHQLGSARQRAVLAAKKAEEKHAARRQAAAMQKQRRQAESGDKHSWIKHLADRDSNMAFRPEEELSGDHLRQQQQQQQQQQQRWRQRQPLESRAVNTTAHRLWDPEDPRRFDSNQPRSRGSRRRRGGSGHCGSKKPPTGPARWRRQQERGCAVYQPEPALFDSYGADYEVRVSYDDDFE